MIGLSPDPRMVRTMALSWGVTPVQVDTYGSTDEMVWFAVESALAQSLIERGDTVLVLAGAPGSAVGASSTVATDVLRLVRVD
jgi:pyruvate kinase